MAFSPLTGELFVVDGAAGAPLRVYNADGTFDRSLPDTAAATTRAIDLVFQGDPALALLIADFGGSRIVSCDTDGEQCGNFGQTASLLAGTIPTAIAINPAPSMPTDAEVLITDAGGRRVMGCSADGTSCTEFGQTRGQSSSYVDLFFAPTTSPTTTTTTLPDIGSSTTTTSLPSP